MSNKSRKFRDVSVGTMYDIPYKMHRLAEDIAAGKYGQTTDVIISVRYKRDGAIRYDGFFYGTGDRERGIATLETIKQKILP